jgi:hypothetical protein
MSWSGGSGTTTASSRSSKPSARTVRWPPSSNGLGPDRAPTLPGWAGDAVLTVAEARHSLPAVEAVPSPTGPDREHVLTRIDDWPGGKGPATLLDGPLRVWRQAAAAELGLLASRVRH